MAAAVGEEDLERILIAVSHSLRRRIVSLLGSKKKMTYSELLKELGVESSLLSFHLRKLQGLVEKREGEYTLSRLGFYALRILSCIYGQRHLGSYLLISGRAAQIVSDDLLLEAYKRGGLELEDIGIVYVNSDVSRSLYKKTVKKISSIVVYVPEDLHGYTASIASTDIIIPYRKPPINPLVAQEAIKDLEKRGYHIVAEKLRNRLRGAIQ